MAYQDEHTVVTQRPLRDESVAPIVTERRETITRRPSGGELLRRIAILVFGIVQVLIALRFLLELVGAQPGNSLVHGIMLLSDPLVRPFAGILSTGSLQSGDLTVDITAIVAFVGYTILELIVLWAINIFRRETP
ncbi:MAG TPA: YggT family protein [Candidatus Limnocylindrales bacterium]|nr:YggT family protein [Candidatus Limnocylindrales bacterium]